MRNALTFACLAAFIFIARHSFAADAPPAAPAKPAEPDFKDQLPRFAPLEPDAALKSFQVAKGFRIELVAAEPLVASPVAMAFDEDGRLFVVEMRDYSEHPNENLGRVRLLEDTDGDGRMDKSTIFAEGLSWPTAVACSQGGVFVGAAPHIYYLKDKDGDGKADEKKIVFTGFSRGNVQGMLNTFLYGLDHRFHCSASSGGGTITRPDDPNFKPVELRGRDFAFDPITLAFEPISGGAQHGASFDDYGRRFVCSNSDHLQMIMYEDRYAARAPNVPAPPARMSIAADGPQAEVFRISPVEPWRTLRTKLRVEGKVPGPIEGGGRAAGYFTSATGLTIYRGDAMPDQRGNAFVADVGSNIIHRKKLTPKGIGFVGTRIDEKAEFIASTDTWFRPVQMANGPDGCLWVADMYRETIEHPASIPPAIKKHVDLDSGRDRGRIYRITREGWKYAAPPKLGKATTAELVKLFEHENAWHRETASQLLHERKDEKAIALMSDLYNRSDSPVARLHAIYGRSARGKRPVLSSLNDESPEVTIHAIRLVEPFMDQQDPNDPYRAAMWCWMFPMKAEHVPVQFQLVLTLGGSAEGLSPGLLASLLESKQDQRYWRWVALRSTGGKTATLLTTLVASKAEPHLIERIGLQLDRDEIGPALTSINDKVMDGAGHISAALLGIGRNVVEHGGDFMSALERHAPKHVGFMQTWLEMCSRQLADKSQKEVTRIRALQVLAVDAPKRSAALLAGAIDPTESAEVQAAAAFWLAAYPQPEATPLLITSTQRATPTVRTQLIDALLSRKERIEPLIAALEAGNIPVATLGPEQRARLRFSAGQPLQTRIDKLIRPGAERDTVVNRYRSETKNLTGDTANGKPLFATHCSACHKLENVGHELGPNLAAFAQKGSDAILVNLLDPNREVNPQYLNYVVELKDGEFVSGVITSESASSVTVASGKGAERTVARSDIASLRATGKSIMPEGLEAALDPQAAADVIAYLLSLKERAP